MLLRALPHSPYVRKVLVTAHETGLRPRIDVVETHVFDPATPLLAENPLAKVPTLTCDDGVVLYDSTVICQYLDALAYAEKPGGQARLFPAEGEPLWRALRRNALGDGLAQAATWNIRERYRPDGERSDTYLRYYRRAIDRSLAALEAEARAGVAPGLDIGDVAIMCALSYLEFRHSDLDWRRSHPALGRWCDALAERPSFATTPLAAYRGPLSPWTE
jgi:glutathione S-transferase